MAEITVFHNPRCSKSRAAMATLEDAGVEAEVVRYLDTPPDRATLESIVAKLEDPVESLVRTGDAKSNGVALPDITDSGAVVELLGGPPRAHGAARPGEGRPGHHRPPHRTCRSLRQRVTGSASAKRVLTE